MKMPICIDQPTNLHYRVESYLNNVKQRNCVDSVAPNEGLLCKYLFGNCETGVANVVFILRPLRERVIFRMLFSEPITKT